jgi:hypothetical protein
MNKRAVSAAPDQILVFPTRPSSSGGHSKTETLAESALYRLSMTEQFSKLKAA